VVWLRLSVPETLPSLGQVVEQYCFPGRFWASLVSSQLSADLMVLRALVLGRESPQLGWVGLLLLPLPELLMLLIEAVQQCPWTIMPQARQAGVFHRCLLAPQ
jgi:hypothetical protein